MTESYQKVHEHLANGSVELCNNAVEVNKLTVSSNQLPSSALHGKIPHAEEVTNLAESEAPKTETVDNNNNNPENEAAGIPDTESPESLAADFDSTASTPTTNKTSSTSTPVETATVDPESAYSPEEISTSPEKKQSTETASVAENPVIETMAVADDEDSSSSSKEDDTSKNPIPGSRMVH